MQNDLDHSTDRATRSEPMLNLLLDNLAEKFPLKAALIFEDKTYTYTELLSHTQNLAAI